MTRADTSEMDRMALQPFLVLAGATGLFLFEEWYFGERRVNLQELREAAWSTLVWTLFILAAFGLGSLGFRRVEEPSSAPPDQGPAFVRELHQDSVTESWSK